MSLTKVSYSMIDGAPANVLDFGATGDGSTDDTAAIVAANSYCTTNGIPLYFAKPSSFYKVTSDINFTCEVQAGYYQIFDKAISVNLTGLREVCFEWFGAKGDAKSPTVPVLGQDQSTFNPVTNIPTGTNDSDAIRATMRIAYAQEMMQNYQNPAVYPVGNPGPNIGPGSQPWWGGVQMSDYQTIVKGRPGAAYLCSGTNILGQQESRTNQKFFFDGQGCSFEWLPANDYDYFIDYLDLIYRPVFQNFTLRSWGYTGSRGVFCHMGQNGSNNKEYSNLLANPIFHNVVVDRGGYFVMFDGSASGYPENNALKYVFFVEGTNQCALWEISHCGFYGFVNFWNSRNPEAVGINVHDTELLTAYPGATFCYFEDSFSGGFWMNNCHIIMANTGQRFIQTYTDSVTPVSSQPIVVRDCRLETRTDDFILFDLHFGDVYVENLNPDNGNSTWATAVSAYVNKYTKKVYFKNCWLPQLIETGAYTGAEWAALGGAIFDITFDGCTFPYGTPAPFYKDTGGTAYEFFSTVKSFLITRTIKNINCNNGYDWVNGVLSRPYESEVAFSAYNTTDGNTYVNLNAAFPTGVLITSMVVVSNSSTLASTDRIVVSFPNSGPSLTAMLSATDVTKTELIPLNKKGLCVLTAGGSFNGILGAYYLGSSPSAVKVPATVIIKYRSIISISEVNPSSNASALI